MIRMQLNSSKIANISYVLGDIETVEQMMLAPALAPFHETVLDYLNEVSRILMASKNAKVYPDIITFAFWIRKASTIQLCQRFYHKDGNVHLGRGVLFHIAPSNVPVNYAYSLVAGLLTGNANIVRIPSKEFPQVNIINDAFRTALERIPYKKLREYICLVRYGREQEVNDWFSSIADVRIIWGGDATIAEIRKSPLAPRAGEITFADRFSIAVIDSDSYLKNGDKKRIAEDFYNDTYLTDQNACTSPRIVVWVGSEKEVAKKEFWDNLHELVKKKYEFQSIQGINKLTSSYLAAVSQNDIVVEPHEDNLLVRVRVPKLFAGIMDLKDNSGYFLEYDCADILELKELCDDKRCQTIAYIGDKEMLFPLLQAGIKGIDRVVPVGKTMDFDLIWDGYNLFERLTRQIDCQ